MTEVGDKIIALLKEHECYVTFKKKDGSLRTMFCTLKPEKLPLVEEGIKKVHTPCERTISAYDLEANGWRSFIVENVEDILIDSIMVLQKEKV
jgi:hypothetical protein